MICRQKVDIEFSWEPFLSHLFSNVTVVHMLFKYCSTVVQMLFACCSFNFICFSTVVLVLNIFNLDSFLMYDAREKRRGKKDYVLIEPVRAGGAARQVARWEVRNSKA